MSEVLVAGVGSAHGADRLGWAVIEALEARGGVPGVALHACATPAELTPLLIGRARRALILDAMLGSGPGGEIHCFAANAFPPGLRGGVHGVGLADALALALALGADLTSILVMALDVGREDAALEPAWVERLEKAALAQLHTWGNIATSPD